MKIGGSAAARHGAKKHGNAAFFLQGAIDLQSVSVR